MKKIRNYVRVIGMAAIGMLAITACNNDDEPGGGGQKAPLKKIELAAEEIPYVAASNQFALNLWKGVSESDDLRDKNFIMSPLSLQMGLSLLANAANGDTRQEIIDFILPELNGNASLQTLNNLNKTLIEQLPQTDAKAKFALANSIWLDNDIIPRKDFVENTGKYYGACVFNFQHDKNSTIDAINKWCSNATRGMITDFMKNTPPLNKALLANALIFQHTWASPFFSASDTKEFNFYCKSGNVSKIKMMNGSFEDEIRVGEKSWMIDMEYGNGAFVIELYKPLDGATPDEAIAETDRETYRREIRLRLPKFKLSSDIDFQKILVSMGLKISATDVIDFSGLTELPEYNLSIDGIRQSSIIELNEKGTKVISTTHVSGGITSPGPPPEIVEFYLDHPFAYIIREKSTNAIIAMGKICEL